MNEKIKASILKDIDEGLYTIIDNPLESIYYHEELGLISGEFDLGDRGLDHNILLSDGINFTDLMNHGVLIVPELNTYISDVEIDIFYNFGMERMPKNDNHFVGYKN